MIIINGKCYEGNNVVISNGVLVVDGTVQQTGLSGVVNVKVDGNLASLECDGSATVNGNVEKIAAGGSVQCRDVNGNISAGGSVNCKTVGGNVNAGGSVRIG